MDLGKLQRFLPSGVRHRRRQQKAAAGSMERVLRLNNFRPEPMEHQRRTLHRWLADDGGDAHSGGLLILDLAPEHLLPAARLVLTVSQRDTRPTHQGNRLVTIHAVGYPAGQVEPGRLLASALALVGELAGRDVAAEHARVDSDGRVVLMIKEGGLRA